MLRGYLVILVACIVGPASAQDPLLVPELLRSLAKYETDTGRVQTLVRLCFNLTNKAPDSALAYGEEARSIAEHINDKKGLADAHNNLGFLALNQGHLKEAQAHLDSALMLFTAIGAPSYLAVVRSNMGWLAERKGDRVGMLREFQEGLKQAEFARDTSSIAVILYNIGTTYNKMDEFERARELFQRAFHLEQGMDRPDKQAMCLMSIGNTYRNKGEMELALAYYDRAQPLFKKIGDHIGAGLLYENIGGLYEEHDPPKALRYYKRALEDYDAVHSGTDMAYILLSIGSMQRVLGLFAQADSSLTAGAVLARSHSGAELEMDYQRQHAELASAMGDSKATLEHYQRFVQLKDSLRSAATENELMRLRAEFETERAEKDNELLRSKDEENTERLKVRNLQLYGSLLLAVLALAAVGLIWRNLRQRREHEAVLETLNTELLDQKSRIEEINGLLRLKVLRTQMDPHFIHNCLNAIRALSLNGEHEKAEEYLDGFARLLRQVLEHSVRDRITLEEELDFLRNYVKLEGLRMKGGFTWSVEADQQLIDEGMLIPSLLVQPFVENAIWHGLAPKQGPKRLDVRFVLVGDVVTCQVEDNGVGRSEKTGIPGHTSLGLKLTGERLELLTERMESEGGFRVEDLKDADGQPRGTRIQLTL